MKPTEQIAKSASTPEIGLFALLRGLLRAKGSGVLSHRRVLAALSTLCVLAGGLLFAGAPAYAFRTYGVSSSFGGEGTGDGQFKGPQGVALNESIEPLLDPEAGDVYVADTGNNRVQWFAPSLTTKKYEYAGQFSGEQTPGKSFNAVAGIAVDNSTNPLDTFAGDVYVMDSDSRIYYTQQPPGHDVVDKFSPTGAYEGQLTGTCENVGESAVEPGACAGSKSKEVIPFFVGEIAEKSGELERVVVDLQGNLFVTSKEIETSDVDEFSDDGVFLGQFEVFTDEPSALAVDSNDTIYLGVGTGNSDHVGKFDATTGAEVGTFGDVGSPLNALAIDSANNDVFADRGGSIEEYGSFGEPYSAPLLTFPSDERSSILSSSYGVAVNQAGTVFATQDGANDVEVFNEIFPPTVAAEPVSKNTNTSVTLNGVVNPEGRQITSCEFEYGMSASYGHIVECEPDAVKIGAGSGNVSVHVNLSGLTYDTTYHYRLLAGNETGASETKDQQFTTRGPRISDEGLTRVGVTYATLQAEINPDESLTSYHFEYDTSPYTTSVPHGTSLPVPSGSIGDGTSAVPVGVVLQDLQPGDTYYYRVVAESRIAGESVAFDGPGHSFTTLTLTSPAPESCSNAQARTEQPYGQALPDCRAYEMVSPLAKNGSNIFFQGSRAAVSGGAFTYLSPGSFDEPQGATELSRYLARRGPAGWSTQNISPPSILQNTVTVAPFEELLFTPSLSEGIDRSHYVPLVQGEPAGYINLYLADLAATPVSYQTVSNVTPPGLGPYRETDGFEERPVPAGVSTDLSHVVFQEDADLTEGAGDKGCSAPDGCGHVYEWAAGKLSQVDISPTGTQFEYVDQVGAPGREITAQDTWHAVSADGQRVLFTAGDGVSTFDPQLGQLYMRENPGQPQSALNGQNECTEPANACTVVVSASQRKHADPNDPTSPEHPYGIVPAYFRDANAEGTRVFFTSRAELTNDANTGHADNTANLYEYDLETKELTDLTAPTEAEDPNGAAVLGLVTAGENAGEENSYVYFVANGVLASNVNANKEKATLGNCKTAELENVTGERTCSLYVAHYEGGKWETNFIATLAGGHGTGLGRGGDELDWLGYEGDILNFDLGPESHTVRVTPDGTTLAFESERSLTGYDNERAKPGECEQEAAGETGKCREVYLLDAAGDGGAGTLTCASCDPSGALPVGPAELGGREEDATSIESLSPFYVPRNLSENGERLFFQSFDPLVPHDTNGKLNVYEWEAAGEGTCGQAGGCTFPISDVAGDFESKFMDADATGENVFIGTADQLLPSDTDTRRDVYDVRVVGGFPVALAPPVCDNGDSCKSPVSPQPGVFAPPASATFSGPSNPAPYVAPPPSPPKKIVTKTLKCKKGLVRKKVKKKETCVKKPKKSAHKSAKGRK